jgi:hypothetical protein
MCKYLLYSLIVIGLFQSASLAQVAKNSVRCNDLDAEFYCQAFGPGVPFAQSHQQRDKRMAFTAFVAEQPPIDDEVQPPADPLVPGEALEMQHAEPHAPKPVPFPVTTPSVIAEQSVGIGFLIAGAAGWGLLTIAYLILVSRQRRN